MTLFVDEKLKVEIRNLVEKYNKGIHTVYVIEKIMLIVSVLGPIVYLTINILDKEAYMGNVQGVYKKNYEILFVITAIVFSMMLTTWFLIKRLRRKLSSVHITERLEETLEIHDSMLIYMFRIMYQSLPEERNLIVINLNSIEKIDYDEKTKHIKIRGKMEERLINVLNEEMSNIDASRMEIRELDIYDYFSPNLLDVLKSYEQ